MLPHSGALLRRSCNGGDGCHTGTITGLWGDRFWMWTNVDRQGHTGTVETNDATSWNQQYDGVQGREILSALVMVLLKNRR